MTTTIIQTVQEQVLVDHTISTIVTQTTLVQTTLGIPGANGVMGIVAAETVAANATSNPAVPSAIALAAQQVLGRITGGHVKGLSIAEILTLLGISAVGSALIDDATVAAQRATLGGVAVGPASSVLDNLATFADTTGKLLKDGGVPSVFKSPADAAVFRLKTDAATGTLVADGAVVAPKGTLDTGTANEVRVTRDAMYACMPQRTIPSPWVIGTGSPANLIANGEFETSTAGWVGSSATLSRETGVPLVGTGSLKILYTGLGGLAYWQYIGVIGHVYLVTAQVKSTAAAGRLARMRIGTGGAVTGTSVDASTQTVVTMTFTATATNPAIAIELVGGIAGESLLVDSVVCYDLTAMNNRNLLTANQSNAETDTTGMAGNNGTLTRNTTTPLAGTGDFKAVSLSPTDLVINTGGIEVPVAVGQWYFAQALVKTSGMAGGRKMYLRIRWITATGASVGYAAGSQIDCSTTPTFLSVVGQAPASAVSISVYATVIATVSGEILYADSLMLEFLPLTEWKRTALVAW